MGFLHQASVDFSESKMSAMDADGVRCSSDAVEHVAPLATAKGKVTLRTLTNAFAALETSRCRADVKVQAVDTEGKKVTLGGISKITLTGRDAARALCQDYGITVDEAAVKAFHAENAAKKLEAERQAAAAEAAEKAKAAESAKKSSK